MNVNTVVVGFDGSECAHRAIDAALVVLAEGGVVHLVSAFDAPSARDVSKAYASVPEEFTANVDMMRVPRTKLEEAAKAIADRGFAVVDHFIDDDPASAILDMAQECDADMIVVGSRGLGRATRALRGSVSTKIAHHSSVDFMVIH